MNANDDPLAPDGVDPNRWQFKTMNFIEGCRQPDGGDPLLIDPRWIAALGACDAAGMTPLTLTTGLLVYAKPGALGRQWGREHGRPVPREPLPPPPRPLTGEEVEERDAAMLARVRAFMGA